MRSDNFSLSVILPAYNEEQNISVTLKQVFDSLPSITNDFEVIVVDDGSKDKTYAISGNFKNRYKEMEIIHHRKNRGYGSALISGLSLARKDYIFFMDSDGQFMFEDIRRLLLFKDYDIVAGIRIDRKDGIIRDFIGTLFNFIVKFMFGIPIMDVDCGFKLFKKMVLKEMKLHSAGALINTEILAKAKRNNRSLMLIGIPHYLRKEGRQTGASLKVIFRAAIEIIKLKYELLRGQY